MKPIVKGAAEMSERPERNTADIGFEQQIWAAADVLRGNMDASEYKHVVLGLIFHRYHVILLSCATHFYPA